MYCDNAPKKLRAKIGSETAFKKKWKQEHSSLVEWNENLTYQGNIDAAAAAAPVAAPVAAAAAAPVAAAAVSADSESDAADAAAADPEPLPPGDALEEAQLGALASAPAAAAAPVDVNVVIPADADDEGRCCGYTSPYLYCRRC